MPRVTKKLPTRSMSSWTGGNARNVSDGRGTTSSITIPVSTAISSTQRNTASPIPPTRTGDFESLNDPVIPRRPRVTL